MAKLASFPGFPAIASLPETLGYVWLSLSRSHASLLKIHTVENVRKLREQGSLLPMAELAPLRASFPGLHEAPLFFTQSKKAGKLGTRLSYPSSWLLSPPPPPPPPPTVTFLFATCSRWVHLGLQDNSTGVGSGSITAVPKKYVCIQSH